MLQNKITSSSAADRPALEVQLGLHHQNVEVANLAYNNDRKLGKSDKASVFTFDLMKTLPTPLLTTGIVYYKRQLWTFCLGIHDHEEDNGYMKVWDETVASRGSCEVASCLLQYFKMKKLKKEIIAWSDACGGQNRNIYIALFWMMIVTSQDYDVDLVQHKFFISGHSYNDADKDFGLIERAKPESGVFVPSQWADVVRGAKKGKPFIVNQVTLNDFFNIKPLKKLIVHRKKDTEGNKVRWLKMAIIELRREFPKSIFFKYSHENNEPYHELYVGKRAKNDNGRLGDQPLQHLNESPNKLSPLKVIFLHICIKIVIYKNVIYKFLL